MTNLELISNLINHLNAFAKHTEVQVDFHPFHEITNINKWEEFFAEYTYEKLLKELDIEEIKLLDVCRYIVITTIIDGKEVPFRIFMRDTKYETFEELKAFVSNYKKMTILSNKIEELDNLVLERSQYDAYIKQDIDEDTGISLKISESNVDIIKVYIFTKHINAKNSFSYGFNISAEEFLAENISIKDRVKALGLKGLENL